MKKSKYTLITSILLICFVLILYPNNLSHALTVESRLQRTAYQNQKVLAPEQIFEAQVEDPPSITLTLAELGNLKPGGYVMLNGSYSEARFDLLIPTEWDILPGSEMKLHVVTDVGLPNSVPLTDFTILLNGYWVHETVISTAGDQWITFTVPNYWGLREDRADRLEIIVSSPEGCDQDFRISTYLYFDSEITLSYQNKPISFDMAKYPAPIYQPVYYQQTTYLVMPSNASTEEIEAALALTAELGKLSGQNFDIQVVKDVSQEQAALLDGNLIIVGTPESNPLIGQLKNLTPFPATLEPKRLNLTTTGPDIILEGSNLTYTIEVENSENQALSGLTLKTKIPASSIATNISCSPNCQQSTDAIIWDVGELAPTASSKYSLSFDIASAQEPKQGKVDVTSELLLGQTVLNVSSLESSFQEDGEVSLITSPATGNNFFVSVGNAVSQFDGVIQLISSPWIPNKAILLVTGLTNDAVYKAGRALGAESHFPGFKGQVVLVREINPTAQQDFEHISNVSLKQLGYSDRTIRGTGTENVSYKFYLPGKYFLAQGAKIRFNFSHSALLDPNNSSITLSLNNTPFASAVLDDSNKEQGVIETFLPVSSYEPGNINYIGVEVVSQIADPCGSSRTSASQAWVNLQADSLLNLPVVDNQKLIDFDLRYLPLPFVGPPNLEQTKFVLPESPSDIEYTIAFRTALFLGSGSEGNAFSPRVLLGSPESEEELSGLDLIAIGRPSRNPILQLVNDELPQPFIEGSDTIEQRIDAIVFRLPDSLDLGYLQLLPSRWGSEEDNIILAVTGTTDQSILWAVDSVIDKEKDNFVKGNLVLTPNELDVFSIDTRKVLGGGRVSALGTAIPDFEILGTPTSTPPGDSPSMETPSQPVPGSLQQRPVWFQVVATVGGAVLTVIVLAILYMLLRKRK